MKLNVSIKGFVGCPESIDLALQDKIARTLFELLKLRVMEATQEFPDCYLEVMVQPEAESMEVTA